MAPDGSHIPLSIRLRFIATNNVVEYKACILGMEALLTIGVKKEGVYGDLAPIISQAQRVWKTKEEHLKLYQANIDRLTSSKKREFLLNAKVPNPRKIFRSSTVAQHYQGKTSFDP